jgi:hypothetical protein
MPFKQFLVVALVASLFSPAYAGSHSRVHGHRSHAHGHTAYHHHPYVFRHGPRYGTSFYFRPSVYYGWGYRRYAPVYRYYDYYDEPGYAVARPTYAANGLLLGALAGAVIGNNSGDLHHNAWRGAALGAATGYVLGSIAETRTPSRESVALAPTTAAAPATISSTATTAASPAATASPTTATQPVSSMASANTLFGR